MSKYAKSLLALLLLMSVVLTACSQSNDNGKNGNEGSSQSPAASPSASASGDAAPDLSEKISLKWMIPSQQKIGTGESAIMKEISAKFNVDIEFIEAPSGEQFDEKKKLAIASQEIPDIMTWVMKDEANKYGPEGAFLEITPLLDKLPELKAKLDGDPNGKFNAYTPDGKLWRLPDYNVQNVPIFDFSYVKAEFEAVGYPEPKNWDEIYEALKKLKEKYPDSTPLGGRGKELGQNFRQFFEQSFTSGKSGQPAFTDQVVAYDPEKKEWYYGPTAPGFKESIAYLAKLYSEKLLDNEYLTMDMNALQAKIKDKKVFMIDDYVGGLSGIGDLNPGGVLVPLPMPVFGDNPQVLGYTGSKIGDRGSVINSKLKDDKLDRVLMILDYMYSDEFYNKLYWNPEITAEKDGKKYYTNEGMYTGDAAVKDVYLPWSIMGGFQIDNETLTKAGTPYADYKLNVLTAEANKGKYLQQPSLPFDADQSKRLSEIQAALADTWNSTIDQFIVGKKSMDDWDAFIGDLKAKGADEEVALYNEVYKQFFPQ